MRKWCRQAEVDAGARPGATTEDSAAVKRLKRETGRVCAARRPSSSCGDAELKPKITAVHAANYGVYGARKVWLTLNRERAADAPPIACCTVERLMTELGLAGAVRGKVKRTTTVQELGKAQELSREMD